MSQLALFDRRLSAPGFGALDEAQDVSRAGSMMMRGQRIASIGPFQAWHSGVAKPRADLARHGGADRALHLDITEALDRLIGRSGVSLTGDGLRPLDELTPAASKILKVANRSRIDALGRIAVGSAPDDLAGFFDNFLRHRPAIADKSLGVDDLGGAGGQSGIGSFDLHPGLLNEANKSQMFTKVLRQTMAQGFYGCIAPIDRGAVLTMALGLRLAGASCFEALGETAAGRAKVGDFVGEVGDFAPEFGGGALVFEKGVEASLGERFVLLRSCSDPRVDLADQARDLS